MYRLYTDQCKENGTDPVKESFYRHIFVTQYNLSFKTPRTDTCNKCDSLEMQIKFGTSEETIEQSKNEKEQHLISAEEARSAKCAAQKEAKKNPAFKAICFDLQKTLACPVLTCNRVYYARQLWTYNLAIHDLGSNHATMVMWHEAEASRGSQEIGSCLLKYVTQLPPTVKYLIAFSDNCGGQNKNQYITRFWMYTVQNTHIETVEHKFLVPGHTFMECDEDFGLIEKTKKSLQYVFVPDDWIHAVAKTHKKFQVVRMTTDDFFSVEQMNDSLKDAVTGISKFQWLRFEKRDPFTVYYKCSLDDTKAFQSYDMRNPKVGRPNNAFTLRPLYDSPVKILTAKYKDLQSLLEFLPPVHHDFYKNLKHGKKEKRKDPVQPSTLTTPENDDNLSDCDLEQLWDSD